MRRWMQVMMLAAIFSGLVMAEEYSVKEVQKIGAKISKEVQKTLKHKLKKAKKKGGLEAMAKYCAEESLKDIDAIRQKYGKELGVRRVSLGYRNSKNAPKADEAKMLEALDLLVKANAFLPKTIVQAHEDGSYKVYAPITLRGAIVVTFPAPKEEE